MAEALVTIVGIGLAGLGLTVFFGLTAAGAPDAVSRHILFGIFATMITIFAHSMMMFFLIGKGRAVKDAMVEGNVTGDYDRQIAAIRKPVFSIGTIAMTVTMVAAILGASVDTGHMPSIVHAFIAYGAVACNLAAIKTEITAISESNRVVDEVNRILGA